jgi:hypothetical protein
VRVADVLAWVGAVLAGVFVPALVASVLLADLTLLPGVATITLIYTVLLGLPVALVYRRMRWTRLSAALAGGFLIGAVPLSIADWPLHRSPGEMTTIGAGTSNGVVTSINGIPTLAGWLQYLAFDVAAAGGLGALGAFAFWLTLRLSGVLNLADQNLKTSDFQ